MANLQAIFRTRNGQNGTWLDYCRERVRDYTEAQEQGAALARRVGYDVSVRVEDWSEVRRDQRQPDRTFGPYLIED